MKVGILCVTFRRDLEFTRFCVRSYLKFARGFSGMMIVVPTVDYDLFSSMICHGVMVSTFEEFPGKGMLDHEVVVCSAEKYVPHDWDIVMHMDSDAILSSHCSPEYYLSEGKPIMWGQRYSEFQHSNPNKYLWKGRVKDALGIEPEWETMSRMPMIYWSWMYPKFRKAVEEHVKQPFREFVLSRENSFPQGFAEFPSLGAYALANHPESYSFGDIGLHVSKHPKPLQMAENIIQFWSHGGLDRPIDYRNSIVPWSTIGMTPRTIINMILSTP